MSLKLDQSQTQYGDWLSSYGEELLAQTIKAGISKLLKQVIIRTQKIGTPPNLIVEIRNVVDNKPGPIILATEEILEENVPVEESELIINFSSPCGIIKDNPYAIMLYYKNYGGDSSNKYNIMYRDADTYPNGTVWYQKNPSSNWVNLGGDYYFKTYVYIPSPLPTFFRN